MSIQFEKQKLKKTTSLGMIVKNHILYTFYVNEGKHKFKKAIKKTKKWHIPITLLKAEVIDQAKIDNLVKEKPTEHIQYKRISEMKKDNPYFLLLSPTQYEVFKNFTDMKKVQLGQPITLLRTGKDFDTRYHFGMVKKK